MGTRAHDGIHFTSLLRSNHGWLCRFRLRVSLPDRFRNFFLGCLAGVPHYHPRHTLCGKSDGISPSGVHLHPFCTAQVSLRFHSVFHRIPVGDTHLVVSVGCTCPPCYNAHPRVSDRKYRGAARQLMQLIFQKHIMGTLILCGQVSLSFGDIAHLVQKMEVLHRFT